MDDPNIVRALELRGMSQLDYAIWISKIEAMRKGKEKKEEHRKRLEERLALFGMKERSVVGDGNCQFNAMSDQLYGHQKLAGEIRKAVVKWLLPRGDWNPTKNEGGELRNFATREWQAYCAEMSVSGTWGDHITLLAISEIFGVHIRIISSVAGDEFFTEIDPIENKSGLGRDKTVFLSHWWEFHYCSLTENDHMAFSITCLGRLHGGVMQQDFPEPSKLVTARDILQEALKDSNTPKDGKATPFLSKETPSTAAEKKKEDLSTTPSPALNSAQTAGIRNAVVLKIRNTAYNDLRRIGRPDWPSLEELDQIMKDIFGKQLPPSYTLKFRDDDGDLCSITTQIEFDEAISHAKVTGGRPLLYLEFDPK